MFGADIYWQTPDYKIRLMQNYIIEGDNSLDSC